MDHYNKGGVPNPYLVVSLCDGETAVEVTGVKPGEELTRAQAQQVSDQLMAEWRRKNPHTRWDNEERLAQAPVESDAQGVEKAVAQGREPAEVQSGDIYKKFSDRDEKIWQASTEAFIKEGNRMFHDAKALGGTIASRATCAIRTPLIPIQKRIQNIKYNLAAWRCCAI